ncbi:hypothetical protein OS493_001659 [Desmophyllum pertusum]|uniref:Uncharacterized protein n=1 Tax=Desmophyllum pertusum TaxID=174260 RepID=A0A9W9ZGW2_9CNID|nr:hypothetical protein OS493_001659 [Desmophyllum pertusum]
MASQKALQGTNVSTITVQSSGKHNQTNPLQALAYNPELLGQIVKAIGQQKQQGSSGQVVASAAGIQTGQPLICYVVPQNSTSGAQSSQAKSSIPLTASNHPVKMILVNANSPLKSPVSVKPQPGKMTLLNPTNIGLNSKSILSSSKGELEAALNPSFKNMPTFVDSGNMSQSAAQTVTSMQPISPGLLMNNPNRELGPAHVKHHTFITNTIVIGGNVVQITFVNEATAISQVVAASPSPMLSSLSSSPGVDSAQSTVTSSAENLVPSGSHTLLDPTTEQQTTSANHQDSDDDDDDDDSTPLSQVAEHLKKVAGTDDVKKKKEKKKDKATKRKKREKDSHELNKPLTAYELFFKETQATIRSKNTAAQFEDIKKL